MVADAAPVTTAAVHTLILGGGPAGLACADRLAAAGMRPLLVETAAEAGGLMRAVQLGPCQLDLGRKELYSRLPQVHDYWQELLGPDLRRYEHRVGILHGDRILEADAGPRGPLRGVPWPWLLAGGLQLLAARLYPHARPPRDYEQHWYRRRGRRFAQWFAQGFDEKFRGVRWRDLPPPTGSAPPPEFADDAPRGWWHPRLGTGQIVSSSLRRIAANGGEVRCGERVTSIETFGDRITAVTTTRAGVVMRITPRFVVSGLPVEALGDLLGVAPRAGAATPTTTAAIAPRRGVAVVYLLADGPPRFPHAFLNVTCPAAQMGRVVNYAAFGGDMVPSGKTCLGVEYFFVEGDALATRSADGLAALARTECVRAGLLDGSAVLDSRALRMPASDPATTATDWAAPAREALVRAFASFVNLHDTKRPGIDKATAAGLDAAAAILDQPS